MPGTRTDTACGGGRIGRGDAPCTARDAVAAVEAVLAEHLDARVREAREVDRVYARDVADRVAAFTLRRGKRLRAAFAWCGWRAAGGTGDPRTVLRVGAALELVQACALIHDDVMDRSPTRRGAPSVQADFALLHHAGRMRGTPEHFSTAAAVLAGDLALAWADDLLAETALGTPHAAALLAEWRAMRGEMVAGQYRDVHAQATAASDADEALAIATLKSALYTVERPLALGAALAGGDTDTLDALHSAGRCAGLAFQLRDDLLGAFGQPAATGKPAGEDLRGRRPTYLFAVASSLAESSGDEEAIEVLRPEGPPPTDEEVARMRAAMERTGARTAVEAKIAELADASVRHFARTGADRSLREEFAASVEVAAGTAPGRAGEDA
ncbi:MULTISPECIES: polyprenyl synthetase family protein [Streptomyces]|uniref:Polyprenyl synthetase family protein n=1 Tax=Streptomyces sudanensis TaxID=436397 RepID=A0ABY4T8Y9_9ACTN|nr:MULTISPECIES: polyprenyl synthetase family protein [Streptomyces]URN14735.1 polyprenyl synthetase family protein [Streptomyces sudanensis]